MITFLKLSFGLNLNQDDIEKLTTKRNVQGLVKALKDSNKYVRQAAVKALGQIGDRRAVEPLIVALKDSDEDVRWAVAETLGQINPNWAKSEEAKHAIPELIVALKDSDKDVRWAAVSALETINPNPTFATGGVC